MLPARIDSQRWRTLAVAALVVLAVVLCWLPELNALANHAVDAGFKRSLISFATARGLHGVLSVLQGTELVAQPLGFGVTLTPGQILAPVSDLTAQAADLLMYASIAFGLQKLLLVIGTDWIVSAFVTLVAGIWLLLHRRGQVPRWVSRLLVLLLFARLVMPVTVIASEVIFDRFTKSTYLESQQAADTAFKDLQSDDAVRDLLKGRQPTADHVPGGDDAQAAPAQPQAGAAQPETGSRWWLPGRSRGTGPDAAAPASSDAASASGPIQRRMQALQARIDEVVRHVVLIVSVFLLQTVVLPLLLFWVLLQVCKRVLAGSGKRTVD